MPLVKTNGKLLYFAHVPKCGGASVDEYLIARFGKDNFGFLDSRFKSGGSSWYKSSPQHITWHDLLQFMPEKIFDHKFAVVRHPMNRVISMYKFNRKKLLGQDFSTWLRTLVLSSQQDRYYLDNHIRRAVDIIPSNSTIFKLENGLDNITEWLDQITETGARHDLKIGHSNKSPESATIPDIEITDYDVDLVYNLYQKDYEYFNYTKDDFDV